MTTTTATTAPRRPRFGAVAVLLSLVGTILVTLFNVAPTSASHPVVSTVADCTGLVQFTVIPVVGNDATALAMTNPEIAVYLSTDSGKTFTRLPHDPAYRFGPDNDFTFTGTHQLTAPLPPKVTIKVQATGPFGDGRGRSLMSEAQSATVPKRCAQPAATVADATCGVGGSTVTLDNVAGQARTKFTVVASGTGGIGATTHQVEPGQTIDVVRTFPQGTRTITVMAPGMATVTRQVTYVCPSATPIAATCAAGGGAVQLSNPTTDAVDFTVDVDGTTETVPVLAGGTETVEVGFPAGETRTVTVSAPDMTTATYALTYACPVAAPVATIADASCAEGGATVVLENTGGAPAEFTIDVDGATSTVTVDAGGSEVVTVDLPADESRTITVSAAGMTDVVDTVSYTCPAAVIEAAVVAASCGTGGGEVALVNTGDAPADVTIDVDGTITTVTLDAGERERVPVTFAAGESRDVTVTAPGMADVRETISYTCPAPAPVATIADASCGAGGSTVVVENTGDGPADVEVDIDGATTGWTLAPGERIVLPVTFPADLDRTVTVRGDGMTEVVKRLAYTCGAANVGPFVIDEPAETSDVVGGAASATEPVDSEADATDAAATEEDEEAARSYESAEHGTPDTVVPLAGISTPAGPTDAAVLAANAAAQVSPTETAAPAGQLPVTGSPTLVLTLAGLAAIALGVALRVGGRVLAAR